LDSFELLPRESELLVLAGAGLLFLVLLLLTAVSGALLWVLLLLLLTAGAGALLLLF